MPFPLVSGWCSAFLLAAPEGQSHSTGLPAAVGAPAQSLQETDGPPAPSPGTHKRNLGVTPGVQGRRLMFCPCETMSHLDLKRSCLRKKHLTRSSCFVTPKTRAR